MMVYKGLPRYFIGRDEYHGYSACMNWVGMHCEKKDDEWLGSITGPHTKEVWMGKVRPVVQQGFDLFWKDIPLQSVKRYDILPLVPGRSYERCREGSLKALVPCVGCRA
jgi:hypothetical protein